MYFNLFILIYALLPIIGGIIVFINNKSSRNKVVKYLSAYLILQCVFIYTFIYTSLQGFAACAGGCSNEPNFGIIHYSLLFTSLFFSIVFPGILMYLLFRKTWFQFLGSWFYLRMDNNSCLQYLKHITSRWTRRRKERPLNFTLRL